MNANTLKVGSAFLVLNALWHSRAAFNHLYLQSDMLLHFVPNGLFHILPTPTTATFFVLVAVLYYLSGLVYLITFQKYALLLFFLTGSIVDNLQVNFVDGGHSRYLQYSLLLHGVMALFLHASARGYLHSLRALVVSYYFIAGLYKFFVSGLGWALDDSIFVHAVAVQTFTPIKQYILNHFPDFFRISAYAVFLAELFSPLLLFVRAARWLIVAILFLFHSTFPLVWGGHGDFIVNCMGLVLCLADEKHLVGIFDRYDEWRKRVLGFMLNRKGEPNV